MDGQKIIVCKNCGSNSVNVTNVSNWLMTGIIGFILICVSIWIPILGWFIGIPIGLSLIALGIVGAIVDAVRKKPRQATVKCQSCKHSWKVSEEVYNEYKEAIK